MEGGDDEVVADWCRREKEKSESPKNLDQGPLHLGGRDEAEGGAPADPEGTFRRPSPAPSPSKSWESSRFAIPPPP